MLGIEGVYKGRMNRLSLLILLGFPLACAEEKQTSAEPPLMQVANAEPSKPSAAPATGGATAADAFAGSVGGKSVELKRSGPAWTVSIDGTAFRVALEADRVKLGDEAGETVAKVKTKDEGFKVYGSGDEAKMKLKRSGDRFKLKDGDGEELRKVVIPNDDPASFVLGIDELSVEERVAAYVYAREFTFR